jgi:hypothetical protein
MDPGLRRDDNIGERASTRNDAVFIRLHPRLASGVLLKWRYSIAWRSAAMKLNGHIHKILANDVSDHPGTKANLARILGSS